MNNEIFEEKKEKNMEQNQQTQQPNQKTTQSPNFLFAILTAIGLALIGCALYGVLYYVGYIAWLVSYVTILLSAWGYKHFNKKMDWKGYLVVALVSIAGLLVTMFITLALVVQKEFNCTFSVAVRDLFDLLNTNTKLRTYVIRDGVLTAVFTLLGLLSYFVYEKRASKAGQGTKQVNASQTTTQKAEAAKPATTQPTTTTQQSAGGQKETTKSAEQTKKATVVATAKPEPAKTTATKTEPTKQPEPVKKAETPKVESKPVETVKATPKQATTAQATTPKKATTKKTTKKTATKQTASKPLVIKPVVSATKKTTKK